MLVAWVVFPLVLSLLSLGCGLALERVARFELRGPLVVPAGYAVIVVVASFAALSTATAPLAVPLVVAVAAVGLGSALPWSRRRIEPWAIGAAVAAFAVFAAPIVLSGSATFAGYIKLDDTATFFALTDRAMGHGRSLAGLAPSSYEATLSFYLPNYPLGSLLPLGVGRALVGQDVAWLFQPYLAFLAALLALSLYQLAALVVRGRAFRAFAAVVAAQAALLYGYALWGGVKELAAAAVLALVAALAAPALQQRAGPLSLVAFATAGAALLEISSLGGAVWLLPSITFVAVAAWRRRTLVKGLTPLAALAALAIPAAAVGNIVTSTGSRHTFTSGAELGNLAGPLNPLQVLGIWPTGDFRYDPAAIKPTYVLIAVAAVAALVGIAVAVKLRAWELPLYTGSACLAALAFAERGSPWVAGKGYAVASPAVVLAALVGCGALLTRGRRTEALLAAAAVAGGVVWSDVLAYHDVDLAPRAQLVELEQIGHRIAGDGPTLMTEYQPYGVRHFLRDADPEGASELRRRVIPLRNGRTLRKGETADLDRFELGAVLTYRTLVLRRSPVESRPPAPYRLVWSGRYYEVWQRPVTAATVLAHLPLGDGTDAAGRPACSSLRRLALDGRSDFVAAAPRRPATILPLTQLRYPARWLPDGNDPRILYPWASGTAEGELTLGAPGRYEIWIGGSFRGELDVAIDGVRALRARDQLNYDGQFTSLGHVELAAGVHRITLRYRGPDLHPGSGGTSWPLGPLALTQAGADSRVSYLPERDAGALCGKSLDWIETLPQ